MTDTNDSREYEMPTLADPPHEGKLAIYTKNGLEYLTMDEYKERFGNVEEHVKRRTLVQLNSIEAMLRNGISPEVVADYVDDVRGELERKVGADTEQ